MSQQTKTFRIFVSSTFDDLKTERNVLQEKVFPELQKLCEANGCRFQVVDLRWGVSEEAALDQQTMNICLTELKRCQDVSPRPNFIILLGDRYGWIPLPPQVEGIEFEEILSHVADDAKTLLTEWYRLDTNAIPPEYVLRPRREEVFAEADYASWGKTEERLRAILHGAENKLGWSIDDQRKIKYECSATHQEIIEAALKLPDEREHVFAFLRNIRNIEDLPPGSAYIDTDREKAQTLKETIKHTTGVTSYSYDVTWSGSEPDVHLEQFTVDALDSLCRIIEEEIRQIKQVDELTRENIAHEEFGAERCRHFVGRRKILDDIADYINGDQKYPLVVYGPSGSGKSALMAKSLLDAADKEKPAYIVQRFIGATPESTDIRTLLRNLCMEISHVFGFDRLKEQDLAAVTDPEERFREFLGMIPKDRHLLLFLDALDQLSATDSAHSLNWLPSTLPANIKVIVSVLEREDDAGECLMSAQLKFPASVQLRLEDMTPEEGAEILYTWLLEAYPEKKRTLTAEQMKSVLDGFRGCPKPLYLKLAFEEARRWKSYDGLPRGADNLLGLAGDVPGVVGDMLARLMDKKQHGEMLVKTFLGLFSAARHGLSEIEILELLSADEAVMADLKARSARSPEAKGIPMVVWLRLYHDLASHLIERSADGTVLFNFYHRQVGETVKRDYIRPEWHTRLARYFRHKADPTGDSSWSGNYVHGLSELPFQQTKSGSLWEELEETLTDLRFIEAKCKAGKVYDLLADYGSAEWAWPEREEEQQKEAFRQQGIKEYIDKLIDHAKNPKVNLLPDPPPLAEIRNCETTTDTGRDWTPLERVKAWDLFVGTHIQQLADGEEPIFQMAWNSASSGPVVEKVSELEREGRDPVGEWLRLWNRPPFILHHACIKVFNRRALWVEAISITLDGNRAVSGSWDKTLRLWDLMTGKCLKVLKGHRELITAVAITPDGSRAVSGSYDKTLRLWDLATGECLKVLEGFTNSVTAVAITPNGVRIISGGWDNIRLWDLATGECLKVLEGFTSDVKALSITSDGGRALFGGEAAKTIRVWDLATGECLKILEGHTSGVEAISITPDGSRAVSGSLDHTLRLWNLATGECLKELEGHTDIVKAVSITPDGGRAISGSLDHTLRLWDLATGKCLKVLTGELGGISAVSITPDSRQAVSGSTEGTIRVWDLASGVCLTVSEGNDWWDKIIDRSEAFRKSDYTFSLLDPVTGKCLKVLQRRSNYYEDIAITPDESRAVSGSYDSLRLWDMATGECLKELEGHTDIAKPVSITPDGSRAISGSGDNTLRLWDMATGECLKELEGHTGRVESVSITPDGRRAISGSDDNTLRLWNLASGKCIVACGIEGNVQCLTVHITSFITFDHYHMLVYAFTIEKYCPGRPVITASRVWLFDEQSWAPTLSAICPWCDSRFNADPFFDVENPGLGRRSPNSKKTYILRSSDINCPIPGCGKPLKLNPFVCDNSG